MASLWQISFSTAFMLILRTSAFRVETAADSTNRRHPIIIVGPFLGQKLEVKDTRSGLAGYPCANQRSYMAPFRTGVETGFETGWISKYPKRLLCFMLEQDKLTFDPITNETSPPEGIEVRVAPGWDGLKIISGNIGGNVDALVAYLEKAGFRKDFDLFPFPYDWRLGVRDWQLLAFIHLKNLVESVSLNNNNDKVVLTGLSMAAPFTHAFLKWATTTEGATWTKKHIHAWIPGGGPFNGGVNMFSMAGGAFTVAQADTKTSFGVANFTCSGCNPPLEERTKVIDRGSDLLSGIVGKAASGFERKVNRAARSWPSLFFLLPSVDFSTTPSTDREYVRVISGDFTRSFKTSEIAEYFSDIRDDKEAAALASYGISIDTTSDPGVPVHCIYGYNVPTDKKVDVWISAENETTYTIELGDGDGTVDRDSLDVCTRWKSTERTYLVPGVHHNGLFYVQDVADVMVAVATENKQKWKSWTSPKPNEIKWMSPDGEFEVTDFSQNMYDVDMDHA